MWEIMYQEFSQVLCCWIEVWQRRRMVVVLNSRELISESKSIITLMFYCTAAVLFRLGRHYNGLFISLSIDMIKIEDIFSSVRVCKLPQMIPVQQADRSKCIPYNKTSRWFPLLPLHEIKTYSKGSRTYYMEQPIKQTVATDFLFKTKWVTPSHLLLFIQNWVSFIFQIKGSMLN